MNVNRKTYQPAIPGQKIAAARKKRGMTQRELAQQLLIPRETLASREFSRRVSGTIAMQFDRVFGGSDWRLADEVDPVLTELRQLKAQMAELMRIVGKRRRK